MADYAHKKTDEILDDIEKRIKQEFERAANEVENKARRYFRSFERKDKVQRERVSQGLLEESTYQTWKRNQLLINQRWNEMAETLAEDVTTTREKAESIAKGFMPDVYALNHNYGTFEVEVGLAKEGAEELSTKVGSSYTLYNRETVERLIRDDPDLLPVLKKGSPLAEKLRRGELVRWNKTKMNSEVLQSLLQGESIKQMAQRLRRVADMDYNSSILHARTMTTSAENAGRLDAFNRAQGMGVPMGKQWIATMDKRTRHSHMMLHGDIVGLDEPFANGLMYPSDPNGAPSEVYNCRCSMVGALNIPGLNNDVKNDPTRHAKLDNMTYQEWVELHERGSYVMKAMEKSGGDWLVRSELDGKEYTLEDLHNMDNVQLYMLLAGTGTLEMAEGHEYTNDRFDDLVEIFLLDGDNNITDVDSLPFLKALFKLDAGVTAERAGDKPYVRGRYLFVPDGWGELPKNELIEMDDFELIDVIEKLHLSGLDTKEDIEMLLANNDRRTVVELLFEEVGKLNRIDVDYSNFTPLSEYGVLRKLFEKAAGPDAYDEFAQVVLENNAAKTYNKFQDQIRKYTVGARGVGYYQPAGDEVVFFIDDRNAAGPFETFAHEFGHAIDWRVPTTQNTGTVYTYKESDMLEKLFIKNHVSIPDEFRTKHISVCDQFLGAMRKDKETLWNNYMVPDDAAAGAEIRQSEAGGLQDALDGFFATQDRKDINMRTYWGHGSKYYDDYWKTYFIDKHWGLFQALEKNGEKSGWQRLAQEYRDLGYADINSRNDVKYRVREYQTACELWANMHMARTVGGTEAEMFEKYMPETWKMFNEIYDRI